jgi:hypothetical protein
MSCHPGSLGIFLFTKLLGWTKLPVQSSTQIAVLWKEEPLTDSSIGLQADLVVLFPRAAHVVVIVIKPNYWRREATHHSICFWNDMFIIFLSVWFYGMFPQWYTSNHIYLFLRCVSWLKAVPALPVVGSLLEMQEP